MLALGSVGWLGASSPVGTFVGPDDFIALHVGISFSDGARGHRARASTASGGRSRRRWARAAPAPLRDGGVYWQTIGPRFETPAEIRLIAAHADVVGMTMASECIVAGELGLAYAAVCVVDNLANGVGDGAAHDGGVRGRRGPRTRRAERRARGRAAARSARRARA